MSGTYSFLAPIYDQLGLAEFAATITPRLIDYTQRSDLLSRRILDLGCGTGAAAQWLVSRNYTVVGVDSSPHMLDIARQNVNTAGLGLTWVQSDMRSLDTRQIGFVDMVLALDVMNEVGSLRELETVFTNLHGVLEADKTLIFDLHTLEGLVAFAQQSDRLVHDDGQLSVFCRNIFDYERQSYTCRYTIFQSVGSIWRRSDAERTLRAFPLSIIANLLQRCGFAIIALLSTNLDKLDVETARTRRVIFVAKRQPS